jgi:multidrug efflux system outer membrane protein
MRRLLALVLLAALVEGCAVGGGYHAPAIESPPEWLNRDSTNFVYTGTAEDEVTWWHLFGDTVLTSLISTGLQANGDVQIAAARVEELMGRYGVTKSDFFPKIDASGSGARGQFGIIGANPTGERPTQNYFQVALSTVWELDLWGKVRRATEAARADVLASEEARRGAVLTTISLIADSYIDLLAADEQLRIAQQTVDTRRASLDLFRQRRAKGDMSQLEFSQAEAEYWLAVSQVPFFEKKVVFIENAINFLLGRNPGPVPRGVPLDSLAAPTVPVGVPSSLLQRRPDVRFAEENLRAADARVGVARARYFPSISLSGLFGSASNELSSLFKADAATWDVGGDVLQPIFHWGEIRGEVKGAEGQQKQTLYAYVQAVHNAFREAENALTDRTRTGEQVEAEGKRVEALLTYTRLARMRYTEGATSYLEVLDAERALFSTQLDYAQTRSDLYKSVVTIHQALAGSWLDQASSSSFQVEKDVKPRGRKK